LIDPAAYSQRLNCAAIVFAAELKRAIWKHDHS